MVKLDLGSAGRVTVIVAEGRASVLVMTKPNVLFGSLPSCTNHRQTLSLYNSLNLRSIYGKRKLRAYSTIKIAQSLDRSIDPRGRAAKRPRPKAAPATRANPAG